MKQRLRREVLQQLKVTPTPPTPSRQHQGQRYTSSHSFRIWEFALSSPGVPSNTICPCPIT